MTAMEHGTRSRTTRLRTLVAAAAAATLLGGAAGPAAAAPKEPLSYVALGDSYASGFGAEPGPGDYGECGRSPLGLPGILDRKRKIDLVTDATCAGARVVTVPEGAIDLPEQLAALSRDTDLVTISAGGNDAGFADVAGACVILSAAECAESIAGAAAALSLLGGPLDTLYTSVKNKAPHATVVVTGYPHLFSPEYGTPIIVERPGFPGTATIPVESQIAFNAGTDALNALIRNRAEANGFIFVDVVPKFERHGLGSPNPWITLRPAAIDNLHPTAKGYRSGYYPAVRSAVNFSQLQR